MLKTVCTALLLVPGLVLVAGCGPIAGSIEHFQHPESGGIRRAAFEMQCPEHQLELTDLGASTIGVSGCGKRAVYKATLGAGWVNNTGTEEKAGEKKERPVAPQVSAPASAQAPAEPPSAAPRR
jgi:hypothetical protein